MRQNDEPSHLSSRSLALLRVVAAVSAVLGLVTVVAVAGRAITAPSRSTVTVDDMTLVNAQAPPFTQDLPDLRAYYSSVNLEIGDPPASLVWLDFGQQAASAAGGIAVCAVLIWLCLATLKGRPFVATAPWVLIASGLALITSSIVSDLLAGRIQAAVVDLYGSTGSDPTGDGTGESFGVGTTVLLEDLGLAVALCVLGATFALGNRLQRDTDRLI